MVSVARSICVVTHTQTNPRSRCRAPRTSRYANPGKAAYSFSRVCTAKRSLQPLFSDNRVYVFFSPNDRPAVAAP